jgi:hypothetical protein
MKTRIVPVLAAAAWAMAMLGCSSARVDTPAHAAPVVNDTQPLAATVKVAGPVQGQVDELPPPPKMPSHNFKACKLGQSCMAMDERPFELCLVGTTRCTDKIKEPLLVDGPNVIIRPQETSVTVPQKPE